MPSTRLRPKSKSLLRELVGQHSKSGLVSLLTDIRTLSEEDFQAALDDAASERVVGRAKKKVPPKGSPRFPKDSPVARIAKVLKEDRGLSDIDAQTWLASALINDGVGSSLLPPVTNKRNLESWLDVLLRTVRSAVVYDVAKSGAAG